MGTRQRKKIFESSCYITQLTDEGICISRVKPGSEITIKEAMQNSKFVQEIAQDHPVPLLVDARQIKSITKEARDHFSMRGRKGYANSIAIVISSPVSRIIGNFFLGLNKPTVPTILFNDEEKAIEWLKQFL